MEGSEKKTDCTDFCYERIAAASPDEGVAEVLADKVRSGPKREC